ncbi:preprotein translocase subunit SecA [Spiroplasma endosymbiont of 'Nebria riversi']|uniref:preprotein translocase subunit SecA n=1 Tax=Spiroplasma endosymbiont of 'Nebria riversi' TaxID=2792084 RepID=UPI001C05CFB7|nr:preprotein translocase subunit SecA [Spiroplasma endosymbiont of 'Nebria riversi']
MKFFNKYKSVLKSIRADVQEILNLDLEMQELSADSLKNKTNEFKKRLEAGATIDDILIEAFAVAREATRRVSGLYAFAVQLEGGIVLHNGDVAEMRTGEGKTLTAIMPMYLNALLGNGVHIVTVNEYLAQRDAEINGAVLGFLGLTVGVNLRDLSNDQKRKAYLCDVTYTTNSELGFDYLRDNMVHTYGEKVQRGLNFAIVDEADSVLIDESRTPLIISGGSKSREPLYENADRFAKSLDKKADIKIDLETKQVALTISGVKKAEKHFGVKKLFSLEQSELFHHILNALKAVHVFTNGIEYVTQNDEIILVDQFTGRLMPGRAYSDGLQQALQAKEAVTIEHETTTLATITYQNFFRLYNKLSGMTGTAKTEEEEFIKIYNMRVMEIPTNLPIVRKDDTDLVFASQSSKYKALLKEVKERHTKGQPILIGTASITTSEEVSNILKEAKIAHNVLNARNHVQEAEIIAGAGQIGAVTIATNMAGRGTDIKLGDGVIALRGLAVLGTERNETRRIDNQLRGRSGRQGDPGYSRFYLSVEDELMLRFGSKKLQGLFSCLGDDHIQSKLLSRSITNAQKKVEGLNFDTRKNLLDYDNILAQQREVMYEQRDAILQTKVYAPLVERMIFTVSGDLLDIFTKEINKEIMIDFVSLVKSLETKLINSNHELDAKELRSMTRHDTVLTIGRVIFNHYEKTIENIPEAMLWKIENQIILQAFDHHWTEHIDGSSKLRTGIYLRGYGQSNPLHAYIDESAQLFNRMRINIAHQVVISLCSLEIGSDIDDGISEEVMEAIERTKAK